MHHACPTRRPSYLKTPGDQGPQRVACRRHDDQQPPLEAVGQAERHERRLGIEGQDGRGEKGAEKQPCIAGPDHLALFPASMAARAAPTRTSSTLPAPSGPPPPQPSPLKAGQSPLECPHHSALLPEAGSI